MTTPEIGPAPLRRKGRRSAAFLGLGLLALAAAAQTPESTEPADNSLPPGSHPELQWGARDKFDRVRFMGGFSTHIIIAQDAPKPPSVLYFPPVPPLLESDIPVIAPLEPGPPAPPEMSAFVSEIFYPFLAVRLAANDVPRPLRARLISYRDAKGALQNEIRSLIVALKDSDPADRDARLGELAEKQQVRIDHLAQTAESLRRDLRERNMYGFASDDHDMKEDKRLRVHSVADTPSDTVGLMKESEALTDAAFFQEGLMPEQRSLLFEAAIELRSQAIPSPGQAQEGTRILSFSPETARIRIPSDLGSRMEQRISDYIAAKNRLKSELRDALRDTEATFAGVRMEALENLGVAQAPHISELQKMAEDIRHGLALLPNPPGPPLPMSLPQDLAARISAYRAHKVQLLKALRAMLASPTPAAAPLQLNPPVKPDDPATGALAWLHDGTTSTEIQSTNLVIAPADFHRMQSELIAEVNREEAGIRESLAAFVRSTNGPSDQKSINDLLRDFEEARQRQEIWESYRDYQAAVLMPGLSASQRQLLFDAGVEELNLPLPTGERVN